MSTEPQNTGHATPHGAGHGTTHGTNGEPRHGTVAFEPRDVQVRTIYWYLFSLAVATILSFIAAGVFQRGSEKMILSAEPPALPMRKMMSEQQKIEKMYPPEPRLQGVPGHEQDPQYELRTKVQADSEANEQLRWIDQNSGVAQIPVSEAMKLIVANGVHGTATPAKSAGVAKPAPATPTANTAAATEKKN
jgi:hypothetical protein